MSHFGRAVPVLCRRFPDLVFRRISGDVLDLPSGLEPKKLNHIVLLFKNKHIWEIESWRHLNSRLRGMVSEPFFIFMRSPIKRLIHPIWKVRCSSWSGSEGVASDRVGAVYRDQTALKDSLGILNLDVTNMLVTSEGRIAFCAQNAFDPLRHESSLKRALESITVS